MWRKQSKQITSKGSLSQKAKTLSDLHSRRTEHQGQFFSPDWISKGIFRYLDTNIEQPVADKLNIIDNSIGTGALLECATPDKHRIFGNDIDGECIDALSQDLLSAGFEFELQHAGIEAMRIKNMDVAIINPPFGLTLKHPSLEPFECCSYGIYGPMTHALSHIYCLEQALDCARLVFAVLPQSMLLWVKNNQRTHAILHLPRQCFKDENANVSTFIAVFKSTKRSAKTPIIETEVNEDLSRWPPLNMAYKERANHYRFAVKDVDVKQPSITLPVIHDNRVFVHHHNRRIVLKFNCGLTQAIAENHILVDNAQAPSEGRSPYTLPYQGSGKLLLDTYLLQDEPHQALEGFYLELQELGLEVVVSPSVIGFFKKLVKRHKRQIIPFKHTIQVKANRSVVATCKKMRLIDNQRPALGAFKRNNEYTLFCTNNQWETIVGGTTVTLSSKLVTDVFGADVVIYQQTGSDEYQWQVKHEGIALEMPECYEDAKQRLKNANVDFLWPCQFDSVAELLTKPYGAIAGWEMGCGKSRAAVALALANSGKALITVEAGLVDEMIEEIKGLGLLNDTFQLIEREADLFTLKRINIISYNRLRQDDLLFAKRLRNRISTLVCDEATVLSASKTLQSRAIKCVNAIRRYALSGTPIRSYPRNVLPMVGAITGDGIAHQPYGLNGKHYLNHNLKHSASQCPSGIQQFTEDFVILEWSVNEFKDDLEKGAKREIPQIKDVARFRDWIQGNVQRRLRDEPDFAPYASCPAPTFKDEFVPWDDEHFHHHLGAFVEFNRWFESYKKTLDLSGKQLNLFQILAKLRGVDDAANRPHVSCIGSGSYYSPVTSKQRRTIEIVKEFTENASKTIVFGNSPDVMRRLCNKANSEGIENAYVYIGENTPKERAKIIKQFRQCRGGVMFISYGCGDKGLNLPQVKNIILYDRSYSAETENQAIARTQRPQQTDSVNVIRLMLEGSIDVYKGQMVDFKASAACAGLDYGEQMEGEFYHIEHYINDFVQSCTGQSAYELIAARRKSAA